MPHENTYTPLYDNGRAKYTTRYTEIPSLVQQDLADPENVELYRQYRKQKIEEAGAMVPATKKVKISEENIDERFENREVRATSQVVCISSALRDMNLDPTVSNFEVSLGTTFRDVWSIRIADLQFASSANIISSKNNTVSWINAEDIDLGFPIYTATLRNGTYTATTLENELTTKMNALRRKNGNGALHSFLVVVDLNTSIVSFTSLNNLALPAQPIHTMANSSTLNVDLPNHGFSELDIIYFSNVLQVAGVESSAINGIPLSVTSILNVDSFSVEVNAAASADATGGGSAAFVGSLANFKFLWGSTENTCADVLGFADSDTSVPIGVKDPLTSRVLSINAIVPGTNTYVTSYNHQLIVGDKVKLVGLISTPSSVGVDGNGLVVTILAVDTPDTFLTDFACTDISMDSLKTAFIGTSILTMKYFNHGFNQLIGIDSDGGNNALLTTVLPHNLATGSQVYLGGTNSLPDLLGYYEVLDTPDELHFTVMAQSPITTPGNRGIINGTGRNIVRTGIPATNGTNLVTVTTSNEHGLTQGQNVYIMFPQASPQAISGLFEVFAVLSGYTFIFDNGSPVVFTGQLGSGSVITFSESFLLYNIVPTTSFRSTAINNVRFTIRDILDKDFFTFSAQGSYETNNKGVTFGGIIALISSDQNGFSGSISNTDASNNLIRIINLSGVDMVYLCCPGLGLDTIVDASSQVTDILAKVFLSGEPGNIRSTTHNVPLLIFRCRYSAV